MALLWDDEHDTPLPPTLPELPPDVVALLLHFVSPRQRLTTCALVCKSWHSLVTASISSMTLTCTKQRAANNAFEWLTKHGNPSVTSVKIIVSEVAERLCLDCDLQSWTWLTDLRLTGFNLRQGPSPSEFPQLTPDIAALMARSATIRCKSSSRLGELTSLTRLELDGCAVPDDLIAISSLTNLEHLAVSVMAHDPAGVSGVPFKLLNKLTYLHIGVDVCDSTCEHLNCLTSLQELHVSKYAAIGNSGLAHLGALQSLTLLRISSASYPLSPASTPGLGELRGLKHLEVANSRELNPAVLENMTALQHLGIIDTSLSPRGVSPSAAVGIATLLRLLPRLQQLTSLVLTDCLNWAQAPGDYAALTASPRLARLVLRSGSFPQGAAQHMFSQHKQLPQLTQFVMHSTWPEHVSLEAGDIARLVRCCPALKHAEIDLSQQSVEQLQPLTQLKALTQLAASGVGDAVLPALGQLLSLKHLDLEKPGELSNKGLLGLTTLTALTHLKAPGTPAPLGVFPVCRGVNLRSRLGSDGTVVPDVSQQLAKVFEGSSHTEETHMQRNTHGLRSFGGSSRAGPNLAELRQLIIAAGSHWR